MSLFQKIIVGVVAIFLGTTPTLPCQNYSLSPGDTLSGSAPYQSLYHFTIQQNNLTPGPLLFSWEQIFLNLPNGWEANLCDAGHCYTGFPLSGTMDSVFFGEYGLMSVGINPDTFPGTGIVRYAVWESNFPGNRDTLTWIITANPSTGVIAELNAESFLFYPNPVKNEVHIETSPNQNGFLFAIGDLSGIQIFKGFSPGSSTFFSMEDFPSGIYVISIYDREGKNPGCKYLIKQ